MVSIYGCTSCVIALGSPGSCGFAGPCSGVISVGVRSVITAVISVTSTAGISIFRTYLSWCSISVIRISVCSWIVDINRIVGNGRPA